MVVRINYQLGSRYRHNDLCDYIDYTHNCAVNGTDRLF